MSLVEIKNVSKKYGTQFALHDLTLNLEAKGQYAILGASGSGKSTLLNLLSLIDQPSSGEIIINNKKIFNKLIALFSSVWFLSM